MKCRRFLSKENSRLMILMVAAGGMGIVGAIPADAANPPTDSVEYYATQSPMTDPGKYAGLLEGLPTDVRTLVSVVQGLAIHIFYAKNIGLSLPEERWQGDNIRTAELMLEEIVKLNNAPLRVPRSNKDKLVTNCCGFSILLCSILRHQGVPARSRCGFGTYLPIGKYVDHWVCEYWNKEEKRWILVDADAVRYDVPRNAFLVAGAAWQMCRSDKANPKEFGIGDQNGLWFIRGNVIRDLASLNKMESLPWDEWGDLFGPKRKMSDDDTALIDRIAELTQTGDEAFSQVRSLFEKDARLQPRPDWGESR